jgi:glycosyltransferase involved in cell wall biosynthesis
MKRDLGIKMKISVCLASYNGEKYIKEQVDSILKELRPCDELIIVDDKSSDNTVNIIKKIDDTRIKLHEKNTNEGVIKTFEQAIILSTGDIIFLSDQDDIWTDGRVNIMTKALLEENVFLVCSNFSCFGSINRIPKKSINWLVFEDSKKYWKNIWNIFLGKSNYYGCVMAFKREMINIILPMPNFLESHDLWIAMSGNILKSNIHIEDITLKRRIHNNNVSLRKRNIIKKVIVRIKFILSFFIIKYRIIHLKKK